ncbi:MAG: CocE/NonD family hydrolase [Gemmatimonadetes bacterium]|nr:CocE/NonD family hydrolase [Gemmatimonadota bacterium]
MPRAALISLPVYLLLVGSMPSGRASAQPSGPDDPGRYRIRREFAVRVSTADGVALVTDVYRPETPKRVPALLVRTPYMRTGLSSYQQGHYWASRGYAYVVQDVRGRGDSEGRFEPLVNEGRDGYRAQSWIARQPWSDGQVGTLGGSYSGWTQVFPAILNNPALKAMIPMVTPSDPGGFWPMRHGGISFGMLEWAMVVEGRTVRSFPDDESELTDAYRSLPLQTIDEKIGARSATWRSYLRNLENPEFWKPRSYQHRLPESRVPMFHVTGWYDGTLGGSLENFAAMRTRATPNTRENQYLMVGPWRHWVDSDARASTIGGMDFGPGAVVDTRRLYQLWFDRYLKHESNEVAGWPHVRLFVLGENRWIGGDDWPLPGTRFVPYYLRGAGWLAPDPLPPGEGSSRYDYDPKDPTPFFWSRNVDSGGPDDYRSVESRSDVLTYTMESPAEKLTVCGPITATVVASSSAKDTDWVARLTLVRADGYSQRLTEGWVRARARRGNFRNDPLTPGKPETYQIDMWGTCVAVRPGERLRLAIMSGAYPLLTRNLNTGGDLGLETEPVVAHQTVYHEVGRLSFVTLPIVDRARGIETP